MLTQVMSVLQWMFYYQPLRHAVPEVMILATKLVACFYDWSSKE